jgi:hypothetical protein
MGWLRCWAAPCSRVLLPPCSGLMPCAAAAMQVVDQMVQRAGIKPDRLLLVGGFGSSAYLRHRMQERFGECPPDLGKRDPHLSGCLRGPCSHPAA